MHYSLLSRFQGTLLGAALGEDLGIYYGAQQPRAISRQAITVTSLHNIDLSRWQPGRITNTNPKPLNNTMLTCLKELIQRRRWDEQAGLETVLKSELSGLNVLARAEQGAKLAIAALPLVLFLHEDEMALEQALSALTQGLQYPVEARVAVLSLGTAIAQSLKNQLAPRQFIPQWLAHSHQTLPATAGDSSIAAHSVLEQVQDLLNQGSSLRTAMTTLLTGKPGASSNRAIALALYCFLSTPDDFRLSLLRAAHTGYYPPLVCALTGALSGSYNGLAGMPLEWSVTTTSPEHPLPCGITSEELLHLTNQLLAMWAGAYDGMTFTETLPTVAAPSIIRPR